MGCPILSRAIPSMVSLNYPLAGTTPVEMAIAVRRFFADPDYNESVRAQSVEVAKSFDFALMAGRLTEAYDFARSRLGNGTNGVPNRKKLDGILTP